MSNKAAISTAISSTRSALSKAQEDIVSLYAERATVENRERSREEVEAIVDRAIEAALSPFSSRSLTSVLLTEHEAVESLKRDIGHNVFDTLAHFDSRKLKTLILSDAGAGLSQAERAARLADIDAKILAAEIFEELTLREIETAAGTPVRRRREAPIEIVLAPYSELQPYEDQTWR